MVFGNLYFRDMVRVPIFLSDEHIYVKFSIACIPTRFFLFVNYMKLYNVDMLALGILRY